MIKEKEEIKDFAFMPCILCEFKEIFYNKNEKELIVICNECDPAKDFL